MKKSNKNNANIKFLATYAKILGWIPVIVTVLLSTIFILVYDKIKIYIPSYSKWFLLVGIIAAGVKVLTNIFIGLGGWRLFKTSIELKNNGVIDRSPLTSTIYGVCDALMFLISIIPLCLIILSALLFGQELIILDLVGYVMKWVFCPLSLLAGVIIKKALLEVKERRQAIKIYYKAIDDGMSIVEAIELANMVDENYAYLELIEDHEERIEFLKKIKVI